MQVVVLSWATFVKITEPGYALPPHVGQEIFVDSGDVHAGYYVYDGEQWVQHPTPLSERS